MSDIENEIQERVNFKMIQLLDGIENIAKTNWAVAFQNNSQKHSHYWEAFNQMKAIFIKEIQMQVPYKNMNEIKKRNKRDIAIAKIIDRLKIKGLRDYPQIECFLVGIIEDAQN